MFPRHLFALLFLLVLMGCSTANYTVIRNVDLFDGKDVYHQVNLVFADSLITDINKKKRFGKNAHIIEGKGMTIVPPLLNAHVHVREAYNLKEAQQVGIFGLLDMFSTDRRANYLRTYNDSLSHAHFYSSNVGATVPGGHGTQFRVQIPTISSDSAAQQFVKERIAAGADYIKLTQEHSMAKLSLSQIKTIVATAHQSGKKVVGHISSLADALDLASQGVDGLAHIWYRDGSKATVENLRIMKEENLFIIPTLSVIKRLSEDAAKRGIGDRFLSFPDILAEVNKAKQAGLTILAGTDAPNFGMNYHDQLFEELMLLTQAGLSAAEALEASTTNIYGQFNLKEFSLLQIGKPASFLLIDGKPLEQIEDIKESKRIWKDGLEIRGT